MKSNVDLTEQGHFSEGWMPGGWMTKGVFRKRKPMKTSKQFKEILKMGDDKPYSMSSIITKLFGIKLPPIVWSGNNITFQNQVVATTSDWTLSTSASTGVWVSTGVTE